ncbi:Glyoxalase/bleomycin resistance protein/dioxygenase [Clostridium sp. DL-VIII]|uniref:VOC family protein n=1 Tax=Clostridium sp. DL-VIII TaxID=641107 RepID=UPI00023B00DD|nr:VOC family protein [Clostridium sp. DL-VIII]EHI99198.1 Glyoxalase/bleomycin resistance protein/dioxygenase [Clostridium sp. DL-VIII]
MIKSIGHVAMGVNNMEESIHFYCDILGLKRGFSLNNRQTGEPWLEYLKITDGQFLELFYPEPGKEIRIDSEDFVHHVSLSVDNIYEMVERLRQFGVTIIIEPRKGRDLNVQAWISDPDGHKIELMQIDPQSPQATV